MSKEKFDQLSKALTNVKSTDISTDLPTASSTIDVSQYDQKKIQNPQTGGAVGSTCNYYSSNLIIGGAGGLYSTGVSNSVITTNPISKKMTVVGDAEFEGSVKIKGRDIGKIFEKMEDRLAILMEPDPAKLEKFAALKKAYDHYKLLEKLIGEV